MSTGNQPITIQLDDVPTTLVAGKNGAGKCLAGNTCIVVDNHSQFMDHMKAHAPYDIPCTIGDVYDFYKLHPQYIGKLFVKTRFGFKRVEYADITAYDSTVLKITTSEQKFVKCSPDHKLFTGEHWKHAKHFSIGDSIETRHGLEYVVGNDVMGYKADLYDLQVEDVKEFYANDIVSHNSTMLDAIFFALFNKPFRNIRKPSLVNSVNMAGLEVNMVFSIGKKEYKIVRGIKPNIFEIYENGKLLTQDAAVRDYQQHLEDNILNGLNEKVFRQVAIIGSADYLPFMQLRAGDRREVIEELLDITIFSDMLNIAREQLSVLKNGLMELDYAVDLSTEKIKMHEASLAQSGKDTEIKLMALENRVAEERTKMQTSEKAHTISMENHDKLKGRLIGSDLLSAAIDELQKLLRDLKRTKNTHRNKIKFFDDNNTCPTCQQDIACGHKDGLVKESVDKLAEVESAITRVQDQLNNKLSNEKIYATIRDNITKCERETYQHATDIKSHKKLITMLLGDIKKLTEIEVDTKDVSLYHTHDDLLVKRRVKLEEQTYYSAVSGMLKDGGIKTKIIKQYIPLMNKIINEYLVGFGLPIEFTLDENFSEVIKSRYRDSFQYNNFSEGEKQRINLSLLLAWREITRAKNTINTNLLIFDETLDSHLDESATEELLNILTRMNHSNIFVISHKSNLGDTFQNLLTFEKRGNFTTMTTT